MPAISPPPTPAPLAVTVHPSSIEAIAQRVVELLRGKKTVATVHDSDPWLTHRQAAAYFGVSERTFDRMRAEHAEALKPCSEKPRRWSRNALDVFKFSSKPTRRGLSGAT